MFHITTASWRELLFIYVPVAYFAVRGFLFEGYRLTAWLLVKLGVPPED